jgi:hypothetical protein
LLALPHAGRYSGRSRTSACSPHIIPQGRAEVWTARV